ncbi:MAG: hypothetical protein KGJ80_21465 [Chloroflexota bacterium]|nr:hypothetical protein [Chloroflexota bacterium]
MDDAIASAIQRPLTYADLFDWAMTPEQVYRFLIHVRAARAGIDAALIAHVRLNGSVARALTHGPTRYIIRLAIDPRL